MGPSQMGRYLFNKGSFIMKLHKTIVYRSLSVRILVLAAAALLLAGCASAPPLSEAIPGDTYFVSPWGSDSHDGMSEKTAFKTLVYAAKAAATGSIHKVTVLGTFTGPVEIGDTGSTQIEISGETGTIPAKAAVFTVDAEDGGLPLKVSGLSNILFKNIKITGGTTGGLAVNDENTTVILGKGVVISGNSAGYGGGLRSYGKVTIQDDASINNNSANQGGGVYIAGGSVTIKDKAVISNNRAITGSNSDNSSYGGSGGGVFIDDGSFAMLGNAAIKDNKAYLGAGIYIDEKTKASMADSTVISGNTISYETSGDKLSYGGFGAGVDIVGEFSMAGNATISDNVSLDGGGIDVTDEGSLIVKDNAVITKNEARRIKVTDDKKIGGTGGNIISSGKAILSGNAVISEGTATWGAGIDVESGTFTVQDSVSITDNNADNCGSGVYLTDGSFILDGTASISKNGAGTDNCWGGAVMTDGGTFQMKGSSTMKDNKGSYGGAFYIEKKAFVNILEKASLSGNTATSNGGAFLITGDSASLTIKDDVVVSANTASSYGGALAIVDKARVTVAGGLMEKNIALKAGGAIYAGAGSVLIFNSGTIKGNTSPNGSAIALAKSAIFNSNGGTVAEADVYKMTTDD
jgi:hypothetical protein